MKKNLLIVGIVVALALLVLSFHSPAPVATISPAGTTGTSAKYYSQTMSLSSSSGTTTSMYNGSGFDFAARVTDVMCQNVGTSKTAYTGTGLANLNIKAATSSTNITSTQVSQVNTNYLANVNIGTSTTDSYNASSTEGVIAGTSRIWPNGTYLIISANATNTASCAVGVSVMPL